MKWIKAIGAVLGSLISIAGLCVFSGIIFGFVYWVAKVTYTWLIGG